MLPQAESRGAFKAKILTAIADPVRLDILEFLRGGEKCVCKIVPHLNLAQPIVSRHLRILREAGLVRCRKDGTKRLYSVADARVYNVMDALSTSVLETLKREVLKGAVCC
jgi:ArsR family transcriptional regulator, arsenate/arsenite/antimonite-responsive transcriptional repressor